MNRLFFRIKFYLEKRRAKKLQEKANKLKKNTRKTLNTLHKNFTGDLSLQVETLKNKNGIVSIKKLKKVNKIVSRNPEKLNSMIADKFKVKGKTYDEIVEQVDNKTSKENTKQTREEWYEENKARLRYASKIKARIRKEGKLHNGRGGVADSLNRINAQSSDPDWVKRLADDLTNRATNNGRYTNVVLSDDESVLDIIKRLNKK